MSKNQNLCELEARADMRRFHAQGGECIKGGRRVPPLMAECIKPGA